MVEYGSWASGAFAIGVGVLPAVALLAVLAVPSSERARPGVRAFVVVSAGAVVSFGWYAAIKGAYLSTTFSSLVVERNLVYLAPLAFLATAYLLERAAAPLWAVLVGGCGGARNDRLGADRPWPRQLPVLRGPRALDPGAREPRVRLGARDDRERPSRRCGRRDGDRSRCSARRSGAGRPVSRRRPPSRLRSVSSPGTSPPRCTPRSASTTSARASRRTSRSRTTGSTAPRRAASVVMLGQRMNDNPLGVASTEFWNRSIQKVWSVDGSGPGPGHTLTPDLQDIDGTLWPDPRTDFVLASDGVQVVGRGGRCERRSQRHARPPRRPDPPPLQRDRDRGRRMGRRQRG